MSFCLITAEEKLPEMPIIARVLGAVFNLDRNTAATDARKCWGILGADLTEPVADSLAEKCAEFGVRTIKLPSPAQLPAPETVRKAFLKNGAAEFVVDGGQTLTAPPGDIAVLAAAPIKEAVLKTITATEGPSAGGKAIRLGIMALTGLPLGFGKSKEVKKEIRSSELSFYLDIVLEPGPRRLRVGSDNFDFSCLKEKKTYSSQVNFRVLCAELAAFAPDAMKNAGLHAMLEGKPLNQLPYGSLADLEKETLRLTLARGK